MKKSGYSYTLEYQPEDRGTETSVPKRKRSRKIIHFDPPFSKDVQTNVGKKFFQILGKHFPKGSQTTPEGLTRAGAVVGDEFLSGFVLYLWENPGLSSISCLSKCRMWPEKFRKCWRCCRAKGKQSGL